MWTQGGQGGGQQGYGHQQKQLGQQWGNQQQQQGWTHQPTGLCLIVSMHADKNLDVSQGKDFGHLIIWKKHNRENQQFIISPQGQSVTIQCKKSGKYLGVAGDSSQNGAVIQEIDKTGLQGQLFTFKESKQGSGEYSILTFCGKAFDIFEGKKN